MAQPTNPRAALLLQRIAAWNAHHPSSQDIDPTAELQVAGVEGLSGGVGDGGHAFGPNQENDAGGVLTGQLQGLTPAQKNEYAWSPQGIDEDLARVASAIGGEHGAQAVVDLVRKYERPRDPNGEISRALGGKSAPAMSAASPLAAAMPGGAGVGDSRRAFVQQLLASINSTGQLGNDGLVQALQARQAPVQAAWGTPSSGGGKAGQGQSGLPSPGKLAAVDGIEVDPLIAAAVGGVVNRFGVTPTSGYRSPSHNAAVGGVSGSDHLTGDAVDFSGSPSALTALYKYAQARFPYVEPMAQAKNHVHISFRR